MIVLIYALFILWLAEGLNNTKSPSETYELNDLPFVTIVVSARNEEQNIANLVASLMQQSYPSINYEIIIVNDRSSDKTLDILESFSREILNLTIINITETLLGWAPKKWALNNAIKKAKGEIILQTDADCIPHKDWIATIVNEFYDSSVGFVTGPAPLSNDSGLLDDVFKLDSHAQDAFSAGALKQGMVLSCTGRNIAFRKSVFVEIDGYSDIEHFLSGDDDLLIQKVGTETKWKIVSCINESAIVKSSPPISLTQFIRQRLRFASKGLDYYKTAPTTPYLKLILPLVFITNLCVIISILVFVQIPTFIWLLPWIVKSGADALITHVYYQKLKETWLIKSFAILSVIHPFYVVIFGSLGPLMQIKWKINE